MTRDGRSSRAQPLRGSARATQALRPGSRRRASTSPKLGVGAEGPAIGVDKGAE